MMKRSDLNTKRQLLANFFEGKKKDLRLYRFQRKQQESNIRWIIDARATDGTIKAVDKQGNSILMSEQDLEQLAPRPAIWIIVSHSGGITPPSVDE
ncbi:hypothetical protein LC612_39195 [Nostoc sp. CHAB 5834]|nr:hypothetical protein [Nostoc sp. CHAB 5834]